MTEFELNIVGEIPDGLDLAPVRGMLLTLTSLSPEWLRSGIVNLKLVDDVAIQALNKDYSGNDYVTDVLSFSYPVPTELGFGIDEPSELGDMVISLETAERQAREANSELGDELATLALHGILHIHGFDHNEVSDRQMMDRLQAEILKSAKVKYRNFNWVSNG